MVRRLAALLGSLALVACSGKPTPDRANAPDSGSGIELLPTDSGTSTHEDGGSEPTDGGALDAGHEADAGVVDGGLGPRPLRFVAIGDTGKGNTGQTQVAQAIVQRCAQVGGCDFGLLLGDNIYDSGASSATDPQFQTKFEIPYANVPFPFYVVLGNHDYGGNGTGNEFQKGQYEVDYTQHSTKWKMPAKYYRVRFGATELFALDTNMQMYGQDAQQKTDVASWLLSSDATWKIVAGHHPYLSNGRHGNAGSYDGVPWLPIVNGKGVKDFMEQVVCGKADLYLCGHDHNRQWLTSTCQGTELAISGAGASTTDLEGTNATRFQAATLGFLYIEVDDRTLTAQFIDVANGTEFTRTLTK